MCLREDLCKLALSLNLEPYLDEIAKDELDKIQHLEVNDQPSVPLSEYGTQTNRKERMFLVRTGTPISEVDPKELPSPRGDTRRKAI